MVAIRAEVTMRLIRRICNAFLMKKLPIGFLDTLDSIMPPGSTLKIKTFNDNAKPDYTDLEMYCPIISTIEPERSIGYLYYNHSGILTF